MKALSLWQPWAHLVRIGAKCIETRSWSTDYRGPLLIHAAKKRPTEEIRRLWLTEPFYSTLAFNRPLVGDEHYPPEWATECKVVGWGVIVARCVLSSVYRINERNAPTGNERAFGDYTPGRFAWVLDDIAPLGPIPCKGARGLFDVDMAALASLVEQEAHA